MFLGPYEEGGDFRDAGISGVRRFLDRLWSSVRDCTTTGAPDADVLRKLHRTIRKVGDDTARLSYNTAIAAMMEYLNAVRRGERTAHRDEVLPLVQLAAAYAPHLAEECWSTLGHTESVFNAGWPSFDPAMLVDDSIELVVQVNGKVRGKVAMAADVSQDDAMTAAMADANIAKFVVGEIRKIIFVPKRLLNIVVG
jgi:leucyl-tRNA synthetase